MNKAYEIGLKMEIQNLVLNKKGGRKMKNKFFIIILAMILAFTVVGCSKEEPIAEVEETNMQQDDGQKMDVEEPKKEEEPEEVPMDSSLEGMELFSSISGDRPKTMKMKMDTTSWGSTTSSTSYYDNDNTRTETVVEGLGTSVLIYNADEETMYNYVEGSGEGIRIVGADIESAEEAGLTMDMSTKFSGIAEEVSDDIVARVEKLGQEDVVYIETTESDEEMGDVLVKMWYSSVYNVPLKYEIIMNDQTLMLLEVVEIEKDINIDKSLFTAPTDVNFEDVDINAMMDF